MPRQAKLLTLYTLSLLTPTVSLAENGVDSSPLSHDAPNFNYLPQAQVAQNAPPPQAHGDLAPLTQPETDFDITQTQQRKTQQQQQNESNPPKSDAQPNVQKIELSKEELAKRPELLYRALSSSVLLRNTDGVRTLLPIYQQQPDGEKDEILLTLSEAMIARDDGKAGKAAKLYKKALSLQPNMELVRLNLAQSLYEDHQNREADEIFQQIQAEPNLPDNVRDLTNSYRKILKKRKKFNFYANAHYTRDNNINNAPKTRVITTRNGAWHLPEPESAQGFSYRAGMSKDTPLFKNYSFRTNAELWGKFYWDNHKYDDLSGRVSAGVAFQNARTEAAVLPYYERRWYGGEKYSTEKGLRTEFSHWFTPKNQAIVAGEVGRDVYDNRRFLNGRTANVSATLLHVSSNRQYFTVGADLSRKSAEDASDAYRRKGIRATWSRTWGKGGLTTVLSANYGQRDYDARDFFNIVRKDKEYTATASIWHKKVQLWGITPRIVGVYQRHDSNHFMYDYRKAYAFIQLNKSI